MLAVKSPEPSSISIRNKVKLLDVESDVEEQFFSLMTPAFRRGRFLRIRVLRTRTPLATILDQQARSSPTAIRNVTWRILDCSRMSDSSIVVF